MWNQTFDFVVEDALHDLLMVEVYDHDTFGKVHLHCMLIYPIASSFPLQCVKVRPPNIPIYCAPYALYFCGYIYLYGNAFSSGEDDFPFAQGISADKSNAR